MHRHFPRWLLALVLGLFLALPVHAQQGKQEVPPADLRAKEDTSSSGGGRVPVFEFILVIGGTAMILFILCMPSRKR